VRLNSRLSFPGEDDSGIQLRQQLSDDLLPFKDDGDRVAVGVIDQMQRFLAADVFLLMRELEACILAA
jgi:hypothetical protein